MKVCLVGSSGGHLTHLYMLKPFWKDKNHFWVTFDKGKAIVDGMEQVLRTGDVITIAAGCKHTVEAITALDMIEVQLGEEISVADKIKFPKE